MSGPSLAGVVLAAGAGRRFGEDAKQLARVQGRPVLEHAVRAARGAAALSPVVVVLGARADEVRAGVDLSGTRVVECAGWAEGMAASLRCGIAEAGDVDGVMVLLGDQPFITAQVVACVARAWSDGVDAVRAAYDGVPGHPVLLTRRLLPRVRDLRGDVGFRDVLRGAVAQTVEVGHLASPVDIDTREQLEALT